MKAFHHGRPWGPSYVHPSSVVLIPRSFQPITPKVAIISERLERNGVYSLPAERLFECFCQLWNTQYRFECIEHPRLENPRRFMFLWTEQEVI
ncbi:hypothetical protein CEXT_365421 [Caerostris extrusa]|uniref:Uncharacterized protein n=1 Tax=Caerostris extrusa TaxID=172846 RepID=A0AAV4PXR2_CAEEX|nr:hypothetical protein CEXT_365421 [Caerostris extrusa]